jgi:hypothetical protein
MKESILNLVPASRVIDLLVVDTDQYAGNFQYDLEEYLEREGYEFVSILEYTSRSTGRKSVITQSPAGTQATSLGLCLEDETDIHQLKLDIRSFFSGYEYNHPHNDHEKEVTVTGFRQMKARVLEVY